MFSAISINDDIAKGKRINEYCLQSRIHKNNLGRPDWQQPWQSMQHAEYSHKDVINKIISFSQIIQNLS